MLFSHIFHKLCLKKKTNSRFNYGSQQIMYSTVSTVSSSPVHLYSYSKFYPERPLPYQNCCMWSLKTGDQISSVLRRGLWQQWSLDAGFTVLIDIYRYCCRSLRQSPVHTGWTVRGNGRSQERSTYHQHPGPCLHRENASKWVTDTWSKVFPSVHL